MAALHGCVFASLKGHSSTKTLLAAYAIQLFSSLWTWSCSGSAMRRKGPAYKNNPLILFAPAAKAMNCLVTNYCMWVVHLGLQHVKLRSGHIVRCAHDTVVFLLNVPLLLSHKMFCSVGLSFSRGKIMCFVQENSGHQTSLCSKLICINTMMRINCAELLLHVQ